MNDAAVDMRVYGSIVVLQSKMCRYAHTHKRKGQVPRLETRTLSTWRMQNTDRARRGMKRATQHGEREREREREREHRSLVGLDSENKNRQTLRSRKTGLNTCNDMYNNNKQNVSENKEKKAKNTLPAHVRITFFFALFAAVVNSIIIIHQLAQPLQPCSKPRFVPQYAAGTPIRELGVLSLVHASNCLSHLHRPWSSFMSCRSLIHSLLHLQFHANSISLLDFSPSLYTTSLITTRRLCV